MTKTQEKKKIAEEVKYAKQWTKTYLQDINDAITAGNYARAQYVASQLGPIWGQVEMVIDDIVNLQAGA